MMHIDSAEKERLLEEFRACLESLEEGTEEDGGVTVVDLHTLLREMAELKNEVRLQSRQFKSTLEELRNFGEALREQNERLNRDLERAREQTAAATRQTERGLLLGMLDLRDRLEAGVIAGAAHQPAFLSRLIPGETRFALSLGQGLALSLQRLDDQLSGCRVRPINAVAQPLDPHLMRAVGVESAPEKPDGLVLRETRRGFFHDGELLRAAEVIVNKKA